jgi:hypothetical protein
MLSPFVRLIGTTEGVVEHMQRGGEVEVTITGHAIISTTKPPHPLLVFLCRGTDIWSAFAHGSV